MSALGQTAKMVQPNEGSAGSYGPLCAGGSGDMSLGKPETIPPEICNHDAFLRLRAENQDLRVALEQSNTMLRTRHGEMLEFQEAQRKEREFIAIKFNEAKSLVLRLTMERDSFQGHLEETKRHLSALMARDEEDMREGQNEANSSPGSSMSSCETLTQSMCETLRETARNHVGPPRAEQDLQRLMEANLKLENERHRNFDSAATNGVRMREEPEVRNLAAKVDVLQGAGGRNSRAEQDLQEKLREAQRRNIHLQEQMEELREEVSRLTHHLTEQGEEAQRKLQLLAEEKMSVKAQVTSLLGELHESQRSLEISTQERRKVEESLRSAQEQQREWEAQMKQQVLQLDQHRLQVQNLEAALKMERQNGREEMRKLAQLQSAYHKLFQEYDSHIKGTLHHEKRITSLEVQIQDLKQQLQEAEEALVAKQDLIDKLKVETDEQKGLKETVGVLKAQADIFRTDFLTEREERARLHAEKQKLQEQLEEVLRERLRNESEGARARIDEMRNRHSDTLRQSMPGLYQPPYATPPPPSIHPLVERQEYCCPKCQYKAPDMDTLQIHVMDCIQ
ncbi:NF-kappa-B essential modulator isoform X1 [Bufo bufo]|uniref:NF-kappa-B essential modulator isoform X1 n=1 Tax=Bufo bufo TaxID=8384 RepID=UPI001ABD9EF4|nr:NF-kappa-B essential modulator isoform X1 [Bufo bufo]XP_040297962.1 NF-kappa-B essential modulator isoform X1 [Bufo bufo]XP_040297963.1 NF-kappa-B essential modulator isoform X1 [Bufo bufo]XP_040297964.1 NF-kappa-B essential modulator isoform X1 [Bufo bufo]XP_040297965.1 NF-kappa-B essential modulator isoform X1 [Bufo bufo]